MLIKVKKTNDKAVLPFYATERSNALDLTAISKEYLDSEHIKYGFGLAFEIPLGKVGLIFPRSSCFKQRQILSNCVGVIDSDYRGDISAVFIGTATGGYEIGDRVAQIMFIDAPQVELELVNELTETNRGHGGYGSTGR